MMDIEKNTNNKRVEDKLNSFMSKHAKSVIIIAAVVIIALIAACIAVVTIQNATNKTFDAVTDLESDFTALNAMDPESSEYTEAVAAFTSDAEAIAASGTDDFAYNSFKNQINAMTDGSNDIFRLATSKADGNVVFLQREGYSHDATASNEYTYNGLCFFWNSRIRIQYFTFDESNIKTRAQYLIPDASGLKTRAQYLIPDASDLKT